MVRRSEREESSCTLAVMARYPQVGQVKTRLAAAVGAEAACALYRAFIADIDARFATGPRRLVWMYAPAQADFAALVSSRARCLPQEGGELGDRMRRTFQHLLGGACETVIMIGADVPHVRDEWLEEAEAALTVADLVLGPSGDGGYYLIAMRAPHDVFAGIAMSTPRVLAETSAKAAAAGLRIHLLPESFDVDDVADLTRLRQVLGDPELAARLPATAACLASPNVPALPVPQA